MHQFTLATALHHLIITTHVGGDEYDLCSETRPGVLEQLHRVWPTPSLLRVPEDHPLGRDIVVDQAGYRWPKRLLLVRAYPDEKPVLALDAS